MKQIQALSERLLVFEAEATPDASREVNIETLEREITQLRNNLAITSTSKRKRRDAGSVDDDTLIDTQFILEDLSIAVEKVTRKIEVVIQRKMNEMENTGAAKFTQRSTLRQKS